MKCPMCKKTMKWQEGLLTDSGIRDMTIGKYYCEKDNLYSVKFESRGIRKGKRLAKNLIGIYALDKRITKHPLAVQLGILRAREYCTKCNKPAFPQKTLDDFCNCKKCTCLYCTTLKPIRENSSFYLYLKQKELTVQNLIKHFKKLKKRLHCKTCGEPTYPQIKLIHFCMCGEDCNCLYCRKYKSVHKGDFIYNYFQQKAIEDRIRKACPYIGKSTLLGNNKIK